MEEIKLKDVIKSWNSLPLNLEEIRPFIIVCLIIIFLSSFLVVTYAVKLRKKVSLLISLILVLISLIFVHLTMSNDFKSYQTSYDDWEKKADLYAKNLQGKETTKVKGVNLKDKSVIVKVKGKNKVVIIDKENNKKFSLNVKVKKENSIDYPYLIYKEIPENLGDKYKKGKLFTEIIVLK